jgi:hypothetical protein
MVKGLGIRLSKIKYNKIDHYSYKANTCKKLLMFLYENNETNLQQLCA